MTAKDYLSEISGMRKDLKFLRAMADNVHINYDSMHGIDYVADRVQTSPQNALENAAWNMIEKQENLTARINSLTKELNRRLQMMQNMSDPVYSEILYLSFYEYMSNNAIARKINRKPGSVSNLKNQALKEFEKKYL